MLLAASGRSALDGACGHTGDDRLVQEEVDEQRRQHADGDGGEGQRPVTGGLLADEPQQARPQRFQAHGIHEGL